MMAAAPRPPLLVATDFSPSANLAVDRAAGDKNHVITFFYFTLPNTVVFLHEPSGSVSLYTVSYFFAY